MNIMRLIITKTRMLFPDLCGFQYQFCLMTRHIQALGNKKKKKRNVWLDSSVHVFLFVCFIYFMVLIFFAIIHNNPSHIHTL